MRSGVRRRLGAVALALACLAGLVHCASYQEGTPDTGAEAAAPEASTDAPSVVTEGGGQEAGEGGFVDVITDAAADADASTSCGYMQNPIKHPDVNHDGKGSSIDALIVINALNSIRQDAGDGGTYLKGCAASGGNYLDVDGDGQLTDADANAVIAYINDGGD